MTLLVGVKIPQREEAIFRGGEMDSTKRRIGKCGTAGVDVV